MKLKHVSLACLLAMPTFAMAEENPEQGWVGGFVERYWADEDKPEPVGYLKNGMGIGAEIGTYFDMNWAARFELSRVDLAVDLGTLGNRQKEDTGIRAGIDLMYFMQQGGPYLFTGLKQADYGGSHTLGNIGIGKQWTLKNRWRLITEATYFHDFGENFTDYALKIGLGYTFGDAKGSYESADSDNDGVPDSRDNCLNSAPGASVDATGCARDLDSDGDGILDSKDNCPNTPAGASVDARGCAVLRDSDSDRDGVANSRDKCPNTPKTDKVNASGCSVLTEQEVSVSLSINFANNSATVSDPNAEKIQKFAEFMRRFGDTQAQIQGHSSTLGNADYNQQLSEKRANAVRDVLIQHYGIDSNRLTAVGYGESRPLDNANTPQAHRKNRRIEAKVTAMEKVKVKR